MEYESGGLADVAVVEGLKKCSLAETRQDSNEQSVSKTQSFCNQVFNSTVVNII